MDVDTYILFLDVMCLRGVSLIILIMMLEPLNITSITPSTSVKENVIAQTVQISLKGMDKEELLIVNFTYATKEFCECCTYCIFYFTVVNSTEQH